MTKKQRQEAKHKDTMDKYLETVTACGETYHMHCTVCGRKIRKLTHHNLCGDCLVYKWTIESDPKAVATGRVVKFSAGKMQKAAIARKMN